MKLLVLTRGGHAKKQQRLQGQVQEQKKRVNVGTSKQLAIKWRTKTARKTLIVPLSTKISMG
jgi:hypothetical protein